MHFNQHFHVTLLTDGTDGAICLSTLFFFVTKSNILCIFLPQKSSLPLMLYLADNLAYIPYTVVDEPLFVIHHIDIMISVSGSNLLQTFKEVSHEY